MNQRWVVIDIFRPYEGGNGIDGVSYPCQVTAHAASVETSMRLNSAYGVAPFRPYLREE